MQKRFFWACPAVIGGDAYSFAALDRPLDGFQADVPHNREVVPFDQHHPLGAIGFDRLGGGGQSTRRDWPSNLDGETRGCLRSARK